MCPPQQAAEPGADRAGRTQAGREAAASPCHCPALAPELLRPLLVPPGVPCRFPPLLLGLLSLLSLHLLPSEPGEQPLSQALHSSLCPSWLRGRSCPGWDPSWDVRQGDPQEMPAPRPRDVGHGEAVGARGCQVPVPPDGSPAAQLLPVRGALQAGRSSRKAQALLPHRPPPPLCCLPAGRGVALGGPRCSWPDGAATPHYSWGEVGAAGLESRRQWKVGTGWAAAAQRCSWS